MNLFKKPFIVIFVFILVLFGYISFFYKADATTFYMVDGPDCSASGQVSLDKSEYFPGEEIIATGQYFSVICGSPFYSFISAMNNGVLPWNDFLLSGTFGPMSTTFYAPNELGNFSVTFQEQVNDSNAIRLTNTTVIPYTVVPNLAIPSVINPTKTSITPTSVNLGATVSSLGIPALLFDRGTCITTNSGEIPVQSNCIPEGGTTLGVFSHLRNGLTPNTTYYYNGYATNETGTGYSARDSFTTPANPPTISLIKDTTQTKNIVKKGVLTSDPLASSGIGTGYLTAVVSGLPSGSCNLKKDGTNIGNPLYERTEPYNISVLDIQNSSNLWLDCTGGYVTPSVDILGQSGTLTPAGSPSCTIPANSSSCQVSMNWGTTNPKDSYNTFVWNGNTSTVGTSGNSSPITLSGVGILSVGGVSGIGTLTSKNRVDGQNNTIDNPTVADNTLASQAVTLNCASGSAWDGSKCLSASPDLIASAPNPTTAVPGVNKTFSAVVTNQGGTSTNRTFANLFQTATGFSNDDGTPLGLADYKVSTDMHILNPGESDSISSTIKFVDAGIYYMRACADKSSASDTGTIVESNENNNCSSPWTTITVAPTGLPDLIASSPTPINTSPGTTTFYSTITNQGEASTNKTFTNIFQTATGIGDNGPEGVMNYVTSSTAILGAGASATTQVSINLTNGNYYMRTCADMNISMNGGVSESNEGNNCSSPWVAVTVAAPVGPPDLVASAPSPTLALPGIEKTYSSTITNQGGGSTVLGFSNLFQTATGFDNGDPLSGDPINLMDYPVNTSPLMSPLGSLSSATTTKKFTFAAGTYYMRVCADKNSAGDDGLIDNEYNEYNNCSSWTAIMVAAFGGQPDLTASSPVPTVAQTGVSTTFYSTITNQGIASTGGSFANKFQTKNSAGTIVDYPVLGGPMAPLGPGSTANISRAITFSLAGTYGVQACADMPPNNPGIITESNETNNCSGWVTVTVGGSLPDLTASSITPTTALLNEDTPFHVTISNIGTAGTGGSFRNLIQMANNPGGFNSPEDVGFITTTSLAAGESRVLTKNYKFTQAGTYYMRVCADKSSASDYGFIGESNESNNCGEWTVITVPGALTGPDLIASSPTPVTVSPGSTLFSSTIKNQGDASTVNKFTNLFQLSTLPNGNGIITDYPVSPEMNSLAAGASAVTSQTFTLNVGTYYMRVCADKGSQIDTGRITESNELNNCSNGWTTITVSNEMSGTLLPYNPTCFIPLDGNSCTQTLTWTTINPVGTSAVTSPTGIPSPVNGNDGSQLFTVPHNDNGVNFFLYNSSIPLAQTKVTTACAGSSAWDGSKCSAAMPIAGICGSTAHMCGIGLSTNWTEDSNFWYWDCEGYNAGATAHCKESKLGGGGGTITVDLSATKPVIFKGKSSELVWTSTGATSCTGSGEGFETGGATSGTDAVSPMTTTTYTITCTNESSLAEAEDTVKIIVINPKIIEN